MFPFNDGGVISKDNYENASECSDDSVSSTDAEFGVLLSDDEILDASFSEESNIEDNHGGVGLVSSAGSVWSFNAPLCHGRAAARNVINFCR